MYIKFLTMNQNKLQEGQQCSYAANEYYQSINVIDFKLKSKRYTGLQEQKHYSLR